MSNQVRWQTVRIALHGRVPGDRQEEDGAMEQQGAMTKIDVRKIELHVHVLPPARRAVSESDANGVEQPCA